MVSPIDPYEGERYAELLNNEGQRDYMDHIYKATFVMDDYVNPMVEGKIS